MQPSERIASEPEWCATPPVNTGPEPEIAVAAGPPAWRTAIRVALLTVVAFLPVIGCGWVNWDDDKNFLENVDFRGLGWPQIAWAWRTTLVGVYQPLGWMLCEAEYAAWGLDPRGYHVVSLALHAANAAALFALTVALLRRCRPDLAARHPAAIHRSAGLAAALFAVHPLRAEVVAWVSCQPYLPSALFAMLAVLAYLRAHEPQLGRREGSVWAAVAWGLFGLALLFKAVAVSLPAVLLVLDVYPLKRLGWGRGLAAWLGPPQRRVWVEKLPYLALGLVFMVIAARSKSIVPARLGSRLAVAGYAAWFYPAKTLLPVGISPLYPPCEGADLFQPVYLAGALGVVGLTVVAARLLRRWPGLMAAWACYLAILAPNSGLVRTIVQVAADRYSYVASIPFVILLAGGLCRWATAARPQRFSSRVGMVSIAGGMILGLGALSWSQAAIWQNSEELWTHALENGAEGSALAHTNLSEFLSDQGRFDEALAHSRKAVALRPDLTKANHSLGLTLARMGQLERSVPYFLEAIRIDPAYAQARGNLALALMKLGDLSGAEAQLTEALRLRPGYPEAHNNLGIVLIRQDRRSEAIAHFAEAVRLRPGYTTAERNLRAARTLPVPRPGHSPGSSANRKPSDPLRHRPPRDELLRPAGGGTEHRRGHVDARVNDEDSIRILVLRPGDGAAVEGPLPLRGVEEAKGSRGVRQEKRAGRGNRETISVPTPMMMVEQRAFTPFDISE